MVRTYLTLEKIRLGERLEVREAVPEEAGDVRIPPLTVQTLVENAVQHGISESGPGGTIGIDATLIDTDSNPRLRVRVCDDGPGATPDEVTSGDGIGLDLVRRRLELLYGDEALLEVTPRPGEGFRACIEVPADEHVPGRPLQGGST